MLEKGIKHKIYIEKLLYTAVILIVYLVGRNLPLYGVDTGMYQKQNMDAQLLLIQTISGDKYQTSVLALGLFPYMIGTMVVQIVMACLSKETKQRISPKATNKVTLLAVFCIAVIQATISQEKIYYVKEAVGGLPVQIIVVPEMVAGAFIILWLSERNKKYGIGGQTALILVNILDGLVSTLMKHRLEELVVPLLISAVVVFFMVVLENGEKRLPMQRVSIHNIYADKNYTAIKLNPIGAMPVMFASAFFMLPQMFVSVLESFLRGNATLLWWKENLSLVRPVGILVYVIILYALTIGFSWIFLSPKDLTEQMLKSGDSILDKHAGKETGRYLTRNVLGISLFSATVMSLCTGGPMLFQLTGLVDNSLVMLPTSAMMLTGIWCNLYQEVQVVKSYDAYMPFL